MRAGWHLVEAVAVPGLSDELGVAQEGILTYHLHQRGHGQWCACRAACALCQESCTQPCSPSRDSSVQLAGHESIVILSDCPLVLVLRSHVRLQQPASKLAAHISLATDSEAASHGAYEQTGGCGLQTLLA